MTDKLQVHASLQTRLFALGHNRLFIWTVRVVGTVGAIVWVLSRLDVALFAQVLVAPDAVALAGMVAAALVFPLLGGIKVWVLLQALAPIRLRTVLAYFVIATSVGSFTPAALGDLSIAELLRREGVPVHQGLSVMLVDRAVSISLYVLVFTPLTILFLSGPQKLWWIPVLFSLPIVAFLLLNASGRVRRFVNVRVIRLLVPRAEDFAQTISVLLRCYPRCLAANVALSLLRSIMAGIAIEFALVAAGEQPPLVPIICAINSLTIINLLPISLGGLGIYEGTGVILFEQLGLNGAAVLAALVYQRAWILLSSVFFIALGVMVPLVRARWTRMASRSGEA